VYTLPRGIGYYEAAAVDGQWFWERRRRQWSGADSGCSGGPV